MKAKNEKTREAGPAIDTKTAKSDEKSERASDLREFDRKPQRKMEPMHERNPKRVGTWPDEGDPIIRRPPIPMTGRAHIPERVVLRCASDYLFSPNEPKFEYSNAGDRQNKGSARKRSACHFFPKNKTRSRPKTARTKPNAAEYFLTCQTIVWPLPTLSSVSWKAISSSRARAWD